MGKSTEQRAPMCTRDKTLLWAPRLLSYPWVNKQLEAADEWNHGHLRHIFGRPRCDDEAVLTLIHQTPPISLIGVFLTFLLPVGNSALIEIPSAELFFHNHYARGRPRAVMVKWLINKIASLGRTWLGRVGEKSNSVTFVPLPQYFVSVNTNISNCNSVTFQM